MTEAERIMTPRPADAWEKRRHEDRKIRDVRYGFFKVGTPSEKHICSICKEEIIPSPNIMIVNSIWWHGNCYVEWSRANRKNNS